MSRTLAVFAINAREAVNSLRAARLRTVLGLIGIMIGISSVITMISLGEIAKAQARKKFEALGTDVLVVRQSDDASTPEQQRAAIDLSDAVALGTLPSVAAAAPRIWGHGEFRYAGIPLGDGSIHGVPASFGNVYKLSLQAGRFVSDLDVDRAYCVIGAGIANAIRQAGTKRLVGELLEVDAALFTIVGVLDSQAENYALPVRVEANESVFVPITTSRRIIDNPLIDAIIVRARAGIHHETAAAHIRSFFRSRDPHLALDVVSAKELIAQMEAQMQIMTLLLAAVGSIALIVGGIGIMNIMLVSVAERRREIGVRRALGARRGDIRSQFLIESVMLTMAGGSLGMILGSAATYALCQFTGWAFSISAMSLASGIGTASAVGVFFGFQPAHQASRLDPIAALKDA